MTMNNATARYHAQSLHRLLHTHGLRKSSCATIAPGEDGASWVATVSNSRGEAEWTVILRSNGAVIRALPITKPTGPFAHPAEGWDADHGCWTGPKAKASAQHVVDHSPSELGASIEKSGSEYRVVYSNPYDGLYYWPA